MKKSKILAIALSLLVITAALTAIPVSAMSEGFDDLAGAVQGKTPIMNPEYINGGAGFNEKEGSASLFVYDESSEDFSKYCTENLPYWAEWKYDKEYVVNRVIFRTGADSEASPRRMGDGYTISGSTDGTNWTVIYTGKEDDTDAANDMYYYIDLPDNNTPYQYYRLNADTAGVSKDDGGINDRNLIQYSMLILCSDSAPAYVAPWKPTSYKIGDKTVINAVDFDAEPFNNTNTAEAQWNVRTDMSAVTGPQTEVGASQFGSNIGWIEAGEWVQYTVKFDMDGKYKFDAYQASGSDTPGNVAVYIDDVLVGESTDTVKAADGTWQTYDIYSAGEAEVTAGTHVIKVEFPKGGLNFAALEVTKTGDLAAPETAAPTEAVTDAADADNTDANVATTEAADANSDDGGSNNNIWLWVGIGAAVVLVIIIVAVLLTGKKKPERK